jgi:hypothetical protein
MPRDLPSFGSVCSGFDNVVERLCIGEINLVGGYELLRARRHSIEGRCAIRSGFGNCGLRCSARPTQTPSFNRTLVQHTTVPRLSADYEMRLRRYRRTVFIYRVCGKDGVVARGKAYGERPVRVPTTGTGTPPKVWCDSVARTQYIAFVSARAFGNTVLPSRHLS